MTVVLVLNIVLSINLSFSWYKLNNECFNITGIYYVENESLDSTDVKCKTTYTLVVNEKYYLLHLDQ